MALENILGALLFRVAHEANNRFRRSQVKKKHIRVMDAKVIHTVSRTGHGNDSGTCRVSMMNVQWSVPDNKSPFNWSGSDYLRSALDSNPGQGGSVLQFDP